MPFAHRFLSNVGRALSRARFGILTVGLAYVLSVAAGLAIVHGGSPLALRQRDRLVTQANAASPILRALRQATGGPPPPWTRAAT